MTRGIFCGALIAAFAIASPANAGFARGEGALREAVMDTHNGARARAGVAPIRWDEGLAASARAHAAMMARTGVYGHDRTPGRRRAMGENLWRGPRGAFSYDVILGTMIAEARHFRPGVFPHVSRSGRWSDVGHFTQIVWPTTTHVGCAMVSSATTDYLVCRYSPPGNKDGVRLS